MDRNSYLLHEPVFVKVFIRNYSGRGLIFGVNKELKGNIEFEIHDPCGKIIKPHSTKPNPMDGTILNPGASVDLVVPVSRIYHISKAGNYTIESFVWSSLSETLPLSPTLMQTYVIE